MILDKKNMSEEDIKLNFITPAINASVWRNGYNITMETKITDGKINIRGNMAYREKAKKVDYLLYLNKFHPIAIVEAKDNNHSISYDSAELENLFNVNTLNKEGMFLHLERRLSSI